MRVACICTLRDTNAGFLLAGHDFRNSSNLYGRLKQPHHRHPTRHVASGASPPLTLRALFVDVRLQVSRLCLAVALLIPCLREAKEQTTDFILVDSISDTSLQAHFEIDTSLYPLRDLAVFYSVPSLSRYRLPEIRDLIAEWPNAKAD